MPSKVLNTYGKRAALEAVRPDLAVIVGVMIASGFIVLQGDVVGKITATDKYRRRSRTTTAGTGFSNASPTGQVTDASVFAAGDVLKKTDGTTIGTVQSVDTTTTPDTVTLTGNAAVNVAAGVDVVGSDGSQVAQGISDAETDGTEDTSVGVFVGGYLNESKLRGLDASAKSELAGASRAGGVFAF